MIKSFLFNRAFLEALDKLISSSASESDIVELTDDQKIMLEMSEQDIKSGKLISQDAMDKRNLEWLNTCSWDKNGGTFNLLGFWNKSRNTLSKFLQ